MGVYTLTGFCFPGGSNCVKRAKSYKYYLQGLHLKLRLAAHQKQLSTPIYVWITVTVSATSIPGPWASVHQTSQPCMEMIMISL